MKRPQRRKSTVRIRIKGPAANNFIASLMVNQDGVRALDHVGGPMRAAVETELRRRGMLTEQTP